MNPASSTTVTIRPASRTDVRRLVELNHAAYPDLVQEGVVWDEAQLQTHQDRFAAGQLVAESDGIVVGAIATLVVSKTVNAVSPHTWIEITDGGFFTSHDQAGSTLYLADIYVDPAFWGKGVARALYDALRNLCRGLGLARVVAGGRLWGYADVAHTMTPQEYVGHVMARTLRDRVLESQLRAGFAVKGLLPGYLQDPRSKDWATLLVWENPDVARAARVVDRVSVLESVAG